MFRLRHHPTDREILAEKLDTERAGIKLGLEIMIEQSEPRPLGANIESAIRIAGALAVLDPGADELCTALRMASATSAGLFRLMLSAKGESSISFGDGRRAMVRNTGVTSETHVGTWHTGFYLACIVRDAAALDELARTPVDALRRSSTTADDCMFLWVEALQAWHKDEAGAVAKLQAAIDATDIEEHEIEFEDYVLNMLVPQMQLLFRLITHEVGPFNESLQFALERHKKYWSSAKQKRSPMGFLALAPLAFASLAHDAGLAIEVESDYLPGHLVGGDCRAGSAP
jgi:hypothetical protein